MPTSNAAVHAAQKSLPALPLTIEGSSVLHQMMRVRWPQWRKLPAGEKQSIAREAAKVLEPMEKAGESAAYSMLGHKGDLLLVHFRESFDALNSAELRLQNLQLFEYLEPATSYLSVIELGLYESTVKLYQSLAERGIEPHSAEWNREAEELMQRQKQAMATRLFPKLPASRYICFYPMDRRRGEDKNWYLLPIEERQRQMDEHGQVGRRYAGKVQQIITGSIGFDDWEWGVDLFADEPLIFKRLIYEMRFDEVSAVYAQFGAFYVGIRCQASQLGKLLDGEAPAR
ncbi:MAG TPA: hydrogen peroxide-dependent heme synthase [Terriglobales bacterium]|nr:hydrogen peroxide-dependent heme synthase [Terriglobales bacterium]